MTRLLCAVATTTAVTIAAGAQQVVSLAEVLTRAGQYVSDYERRFSVLVAEERYVQEIRRPTVLRGGVTQRRVLRSDYLLVQLDTGAGAGWMPFRDVYEVDGRPVRDREDRLASLFMVPATNAALDQAVAIMADSTRYNFGGVTRTVNIPTLALLFVHPDLRPRFQFSHKGTDVVAGYGASVLEFRETRRPTLIKTSNGRDLALTGRLWIDPNTGVILKTNLTAADAAVRATVTVTFREDADLELWVPEQMDEHYKAARSTDDIHGLATYTNYRKFQVSTDESLRKPPGR